MFVYQDNNTLRQSEQGLHREAREGVADGETAVMLTHQESERWTDKDRERGIQRNMTEMDKERRKDAHGD